MDINKLKLALDSGNYRISLHAIEESTKDALTIKDVLQSMQVSKIIENYSEDKPLPSCLVLSFLNESPIHTVWAFDVLANKAILVTVYKPDPEKWVEYKERKK
ncbi:MAG: hypothetical protein A3B68_09405 [Candidatus Melainabacteria bacterium RIFCSPHIGHO2_02_FULL_34_12]|nr:MAG: hypothetical protein A3B68_09405 [Candidatus Melainabacteria bacterium RIFCSPHIGHO2_02_FULL_34_12]